jgi:hypothetical protein
MTKRFCDLCETEMTQLDDLPFIRQLPLRNSSAVVVSLAVTNEHLHAVNDICNQCKLKIVNEGEPYVSPHVATLQQTRPNLEPLPTLFDTTPFTPSQPAATTKT